MVGGVKWYPDADYWTAAGRRSAVWGEKKKIPGREREKEREERDGAFTGHGHFGAA